QPHNLDANFNWYYVNQFIDHDMFMCFCGGGIRHKTTQEATQSFYKDRDALDSVPFKKKSKHIRMFYMPGSPMDEEEDEE
ncbi:hypothetical protein BDR04DRAFT_989528, partial [Suillus decipiens]